MSKRKIKLVVFKEHTLGYILPELPKYVQVFRASILKGAPFEVHPDSKYINKESEVRLASKEDFKDYRCCWSDSYDNDPFFEYEYAKG